MKDRIAAAMQVVEAGSSLDAALSDDFCFAVLSVLGSKYLAVGAPESLGIVDCGEAARLIVAAHEIVFGELEVRSVGDNDLSEPSVLSVEECLASDVVCLATDLDFEATWVAMGSHINARSEKRWSQGFERLLKASVFASNAGHMKQDIPRYHGALSEIIAGSVSGRVGDEITGLLCAVVRDSEPSP